MTIRKQRGKGVEGLESGFFFSAPPLLCSSPFFGTASATDSFILLPIRFDGNLNPAGHAGPDLELAAVEIQIDGK